MDLQLRHVATDYRLLYAGLSPNCAGSCVLLYWEREVPRGTYPLPDTEIAIVRSSGEIDRVAIAAPHAGVYHADLLGDGKLLLASVSPYDSTADNVNILSSRGEVLSSFFGGEGIDHVQADSKGRIWIGYSDQGVFSDDPTAQPGYLRFATDGTFETRFRDESWSRFRVDCFAVYAMNVDENDEFWLHCYTSTDRIVRHSETKTTVYDGFPNISFDAFAVHERMLLTASHQTRGKCAGFHVVDLDNGRYAKVELTRPDGEDFQRTISVAGRGSTLWIADQGSLFNIDIAALQLREQLRTHVPTKKKRPKRKPKLDFDEWREAFPH